MVTCSIAAEHALQHVEKNLFQIELAFRSHEIEKSQYALYAGFDESLIRTGVGYLEQIHVFTLANIAPESPLLSQLGKIFSPFASILFTTSYALRPPVYKTGGLTTWDFDELTFKTASRIIDRGSAAAMPLTAISLSQTTNKTTTSGLGSTTASGSDGDGNKGRDERTGEEHQDHGNGDDSGNDQVDRSSDEDPSDEPFGKGTSSKSPTISFQITSEIFASQKGKLFQCITAEGALTIQMERKAESTTCQVQFVKLKFDNVIGTTPDTGFEQDHLRVTIDSRQKNAELTVLKPQRTLAFEKETKVITASKRTTTKSGGISASLGSKPQIALTANLAKATESMEGAERKRYTSRITQQRMHGVIWWGFYMDDPYERQGGINMSDELLPAASFKFKHHNDPPVPDRIDLEVTSHWSIIAPDTQDRTWLEKIVFRGSNGPSYSNFSHMIALMVPSNWVKDCGYTATLQVECGPRGPSILGLDIDEEAGAVEVMSAMLGRRPDTRTNYEDTLKESILELPTLRNVRRSKDLCLASPPVESQPIPARIRHQDG